MVSAIRDDREWTVDEVNNEAKYLLTWEYSPEAFFPSEHGTENYTDFFSYSPANAQGLHSGSGLKDALYQNDAQEITYTAPTPDNENVNGKTRQEDLPVAYQNAGYDYRPGTGKPVQNRDLCRP